MKEKLAKMKRTQVFNLIVGILFSMTAILILVLDVSDILNPKDFSIFAAMVGGSVSALTSYYRWKKILRDPQKTEEYLNKEYDERNLTIALHTAIATLSFLGYIGVTVACVFAYINKTVFLTLMWTLVVGLLLYGLFHSYYKRKY